jgi:hypothetical protein
MLPLPNHRKNKGRRHQSEENRGHPLNTCRAATNAVVSVCHKHGPIVDMIIVTVSYFFACN